MEKLQQFLRDCSNSKKKIMNFKISFYEVNWLEKKTLNQTW